MILPPPFPPAGHAFFHGEEPKDELRAGMAISIEVCGLYLGDFGVRIEDTIIVMEKGHHEVTRHGRSL